MKIVDQCTDEVVGSSPITRARLDRPVKGSVLFYPDSYFLVPPDLFPLLQLFSFSRCVPAKYIDKYGVFRLLCCGSTRGSVVCSFSLLESFLGHKIALQSQIDALTLEQQKINDFVKTNENKLSLLGWFVKLFY